MTLCRLLAAICIVLAVCGSRTCRAQTLDDTALWFAAFGNREIKSLGEGNPYRWWLDTHLRLTDDTNGFQQSILRPGLGYEVFENQTLWAGYAWVLTSPILGEDYDEHRLWQQWMASQSCGDWKLLHRSRFEQRWVETGEDIGLRWRQMHRIQKTFANDARWSWIGWDEVFFNFNDTDWNAKGGFDQNRAFLGLGFKRSPEARVRTEIGYLNQVINRQGTEDGMNHILSMNFFY